MRALAVLARLALARSVHRPLRSVLVGAGIAGAAAMLAASLAGSLLTEDRAVQRAVGALPESERATRAVWGGFGGLSGEPFAGLDRVARTELERALGSAPTAGVVFRELRDGGTLAVLGALDGLERHVRLLSGRLPESCRAGRCELLQVEGSRSLRSFAGLRVVGRGELLPGAPVPVSGLGAPSEGETPGVGSGRGVRHARRGGDRAGGRRHRAGRRSGRRGRGYNCRRPSADPR